MSNALFAGVSPDHQLAIVDLIMDLANASQRAAAAGLPLATIAGTIQSRASEIQSLVYLERAEAPQEAPKAPKKDLTDIGWFDMETAPRDGRFIILAPVERDGYGFRVSTLWIGDGVLASWAMRSWGISTDLHDLSSADSGFLDDVFYAWRPWNGSERPAPREVESVAADSLHPPQEPIETVGSILSLELPEYVTIRSTLLSEPDRKILLQIMQEADRIGSKPVRAEPLSDDGYRC